MSGKSQQKTISKAFQISSLEGVLEVLLLALLGAFAIILRAKLRIPMGIPGHHGLEVMAILMIGRSMSKISFATTISAVTAMLLMQFSFMGIKDPFLPFIYILMGISIDVLFYFLKSKKYQLLILSIVGGLAYAVIPISRLIISLFGYPYQLFIKSGYILPILTHLFFGIAGALLGAGLVFSLKKLRKNKS